MIFSIDHIVFAASASERDELTTTLTRCGFSPERFTLEFPEIGAASESLSYAGGGFVEFVVEHDAALSPGLWFAETPRVIGLGFSSDRFDADTGGWSQPQAWSMNEDHVLPDGTVLTIHAAGPHLHRSEFYVFVMDRDRGRLEFPGTAATPRLREIRIEGADAPRWRSDLAAWLALAGGERTLQVGEVLLSFAEGPRPGVRAGLVFSAPVEQSTTLPLAAGSITLLPERG